MSGYLALQAAKERAEVQRRGERIRSAREAKAFVLSAQTAIREADGCLSDIGGEDVFPRAGEALWAVSEALDKLVREMGYVVDEVEG